MIDEEFFVINEENIWYLKVLQKEYSVFQPEIRRAIDYAIEILEWKQNQLKKKME